MLRTFKFRLFTNSNQERELERTLETHRRIYNAALDGRTLCWETAGVDWNVFEQGRWLTIQRRLNPHWGQVNATSSEQTLRRLDKSFKAFFARVKRGEKPGFPRFKGRDQFESFVLRGGNHGGYRISGSKVRVSGIGTIRLRLHRPIPIGAQHKTLTVRREGGKWFACFSVELPDGLPSANTKQVGIDVGLKTFVTTSDGESLGDTRCLERSLPVLRRRQRALSRCKRGSNRRKQVKRRVTSLHARVRNTRRDIHHKVAKSLVDRYGVIAAESLNVLGMLKNHSLARRISDAGWYSFIQILSSKAENAGARVILVDPKNTSQQCSSCGEIVRKSLAVRIHRCECGLVLDRDENAARNILGRAVPEGAKAGLLALS